MPAIHSSYNFQIWPISSSKIKNISVNVRQVHLRKYFLFYTRPCLKFESSNVLYLSKILFQRDFNFLDQKAPVAFWQHGARIIVL